MLTIKIRAGDAGAIEAYYSQLNEEVKEGHGPEDYYNSEAPGLWMGGAAEQLGLTNQRVRGGDFARAASGFLPDGSGQVQNAGKEGRRAGYDFCFGAPKSVSVLWALANPAEKNELDQMMRRATARALEYAERHGIAVRYGKAGKYKQRGQVLASVYTHHTSRAVDPHLHCHAFVHNVVISEDGKPRTLEMREAGIWSKAIGAAFRAELAQELQELGYTIQRRGEGFEVAEIDPRLIDEFSTRSKDIKQHLEEKGQSYTYENAHRAGLDTRRKKELVDVAELETQWRARAEAALLRPKLKEEPEPELEGVDIQLTAQESVFTEPQAAARWMQRVQWLKPGEIVGDDAVRYGEALNELFLDRYALKLSGGRWATEESREREKTMLRASDELIARCSHEIPEAEIEAAITAMGSLSDEQAAAVRASLAGGDLSLIQGAAGAGKTFSMKPVVEAYQRAGYEVHGLAPGADAGRKLSADTGIKSATVSLELIRREQRDKRWDAKQVFIVDEAGMLGTRDAAELIEAARESGAKLLLVGDTKQLQAVPAGAPFRQLQERHGYTGIETTRRQIDPQDREMVDNLRAGKVDAVVKSLHERGRIHIGGSDREAKREIARDLLSDLDAGLTSYALAQRRRAVLDINENVRELRKERGELTGGRVASVKYRDSSTKTDKTVHKEFAPGDRIVLMRNVNVARRKRKMGGDIVNGAKGVVNAIEAGRVPSSARIRIKLDDGTFREFDTSDYGYLDHAYALTVHKSQGATWDRCRVFAAGDDFGAREAGYVSMSRARGETHVYGDKQAIVDMARSWREEAQKLNALDFELEPRPATAPALEPKPEARHVSGEAAPNLADKLGFGRTRTPAAPASTEQPDTARAREREPAPNSDEALRRQRQAEGAQILRERERAAVRAELGIPDWRDEHDPERRRELKELERKALGAKRLSELREQQREERIERGLEPEPRHHHGPSMSPGM